MVCGVEGSTHESMRPSGLIAANQSRGRMHPKMRFYINILNSNDQFPGPVKGPGRKALGLWEERHGQGAEN